MRTNVFTKSNIELISGRISTITVGDQWMLKGLNESECVQYVIVAQLFSGDCSDYDILGTDGRFYKTANLVTLVSRQLEPCKKL
jgi:hypothetical protein